MDQKAIDAKQNQIKAEQTRQKIASVKTAVRTYYVTVGQYPTQSEGFRALLNPPDGLKPMLDAEPKDEWGNALRYFNPPLRGNGPFEIRSKGPDGEERTDDDLSSMSAH